MRSLAARLRRLHRDDGIVAVEFVIMAPAMLLLLGVVVLYGRIAGVSGQLESAARDAARSASMQSTLDDAQETADSIVIEALGADTCSNSDVTTVGGVFQSGATLDVTVRCTYRISGLGLPGFPGSLTKTAVFSSPIDPNRGLGQ